MRYSITLAAIPLPLLMWAAWPKAAAVPAKAGIVVKAVATEGVTAHRLDDTTFSARWRPVIQLPAAMPSRVSTVAADETLAGGSSTAAARQPSRRIALHRAQVRRASLRGDVCARHHLRKVLTNGGRSWRCRR